jgi:hypothetical protein
MLRIADRTAVVTAVALVRRHLATPSVALERPIDLGPLISEHRALA